MDSTTLFLHIITYGFSLWLGLYLLARNFSNVAMRLTGLGVISYAFAILTNILNTEFNSSTEFFFAAQSFFILLPAIFWTAALNNLLPEESRLHKSIFIVWGFIALPISVFLPVALLTVIILGIEILITPIFIIPLLLVFFRFVRFSRHTYPTKWKGLLLIATLFFTLSTGLTIVPIAWLPERWMLAAIGIDLEILAYIIAAIDAFEEGENLRRDMLRSFGITAMITTLIAGQVALAIQFATGLTPAMVMLLLGTISASIIIITMYSPILNFFDRLLYSRTNQMRQDRADFRAANESTSRLNLSIDLEAISDEEFTRYTRRAFSHFGDLPRLASNPLTRLPLIKTRLEAKQSRTDTLNRAAELKLLLAESVNRLKPSSSADFGTSDEWRHFNSLHFPYVLGLKPYRRESSHANLAPSAKQALDWFRVDVPERTLHNWQNAAAKLVAQDMREQLHSN